MKNILLALCALLLVPTLALANSDMVSISELRQQAEARRNPHLRGNWTQNADNESNLRYARGSA